MDNFSSVDNFAEALKKLDGAELVSVSETLSAAEEKIRARDKKIEELEEELEAELEAAQEAAQEAAGYWKRQAGKTLFRPEK